MEPITRFTAGAVALPVDNIDTDQIIPARFLSTITRAGLGDSLFADWRYAAGGREPVPDFVLNSPAGRAAGVLVAGDHFGCGSSREHAPWALRAFGLRAVVSTSFADIFRNNALGNGLLPIQLAPAEHAALLAAVVAEPGAPVHVDLEACTIGLLDGEAWSFPVEPFARHCLLHGLDRLGFLLETADDIDAYEARAGVGPLTRDAR
jgi:3-isopropylmalate/(R)-2-methylmalate dehydratase small subunit